MFGHEHVRASLESASTRATAVIVKKNLLTVIGRVAF
jgi:hypothetical protein